MLVYFALADAIFCVTLRQTPDAKLKFALAPTPTPDASQWNIGCVGSLALGLLRWACTFHIFCVDFICVGHPTQTRFSVEYGL